MLVGLKELGVRLEDTLVGNLTPTVRQNMRIEVWSALAYGAFYAIAIAFVPVILRRSGATPFMLGLYTSEQFLGSVLTAFSIVLMRRRRTMTVIALCWFIGRSLFLLLALVVQPIWMIVICAVFWSLEAFPTPGYTRILQKIYPDGLRGKVMSVVRMGRIGAIMLVTPIAGWALDHLGYQILFPLGGLLGLVATFFFTRLTINEGALPMRETKTLSELWEITRKDRPFAYYLRSFALYGTGTLISWTIYPLVQVDRLHLSYSQLGVLGFVQSIFWLSGYFFWGRLVDRRGGLYVLRMTCLIAVLAPGSYLLASAGWMLLPAFAAQGLVNSGWDMGMINAGIQLAPANRVVEYAAIQSTVVGIRGMIVPLIGVGLLRVGVPDTGIFAVSMVLMVAAWFMFGSVQAPTPPPGPETRYHWPIRFRWPLS